MPTVTIHHLEVRFQVSGDSDRAVFTRLFERHINAWCRAYEEQCAREKRGAMERGFGDRKAKR